MLWRVARSAARGSSRASRSASSVAATAIGTTRETWRMFFGSTHCSGTTGNCPAEVPTTGSYPRRYLIHDQSGGTHVSYRMTVALNPSQGEYYGVQGTTWQHPPILNNPTQTKMVNGKQLMLYVNGGKMSMVAWRTPQGVYWISNDLTDDLSNQQMVAIASSLTRA